VDSFDRDAIMELEMKYVCLLVTYEVATNFLGSFKNEKFCY
jgi:hypothetical protein